MLTIKIHGEELAEKIHLSLAGTPAYIDSDIILTDMGNYSDYELYVGDENDNNLIISIDADSIC